MEIRRITPLFIPHSSACIHVSSIFCTALLVANLKLVAINALYSTFLRFVVSYLKLVSQLLHHLSSCICFGSVDAQGLLSSRGIPEED